MKKYSSFLQSIALAGLVFLAPRAWADLDLTLPGGLDNLKDEITDACHDDSISEAQTRYFCRPWMTTASTDQDAGNHPLASQCLGMAKGLTDSSAEIRRLLAIPGIRRVLLPGRLSVVNGTDPTNAPKAIYRIAAPVSLRLGQSLEGFPEGPANNKFIPDILVPLSASFTSRCQYVDDLIKRDLLNGTVVHGVGQKPFVIGLLEDCTALGNLRILSYLPGSNGNFSVPMVDDRIQVDGRYSCRPSQVEDQGKLKYEQDPATGTWTNRYMDLVKAAVFTAPVMVQVSSNIDLYKNFFTKSADSTGKVIYTPIPTPTPQVPPVPVEPRVRAVQHVKLWNLDFGSPSLPMANTAIEWGSMRSTANSYLENFHFYGDATKIPGRRGSSFALTFDSSLFRANVSRNIYLKNGTIEAPTTGVILAGATGIVLDTWTITNAAQTSIQAHPGDGGNGLGLTIRNLSTERLTGIRFQDQQLYGLVTVTRVPFTVHNGYFVFGSDALTHPYGVTLAPDWTTQDVFYEPRKPETRVTIENSYFRGYDTNDEPGRPGEYLILENMGPSYLGSDRSWLDIRNSTFVGGKTAIQARDLIVNSNLCYDAALAAKATEADFIAAYPKCGDRAYENTYRDYSSKFFPFIRLEQLVGMTKQLIDGGGLAGAPWSNYGPSTTTNPLFDQVVSGFGARHSNMSIRNSLFRDQTGPAINLDRGRLYLQSNRFIGTGGDAVVQLGGDGDYLRRGYSYLGGNDVSQANSSALVKFQADYAPAHGVTIRPHSLPPGMQMLDAVTPHAAIHFKRDFGPDSLGKYTYLYPGPIVKSGVYQKGDRVFLGSDVFERTLPSGPSCTITCPAADPACTVGAVSQPFQAGYPYQSGEQVRASNGKVYEAQINMMPNESSADPAQAPHLWQWVSDKTVLCLAP